MNIIIFLIVILIWTFFILVSITYTYLDEIIELIDKTREITKKIVEWFRK